MNEMRKLIEVTIVLRKNGEVDYEFYEPESGDFTRVSTTLQDMADEMEEQEDDYETD